MLSTSLLVQVKLSRSFRFSGVSCGPLNKPFRNFFPRCTSGLNMKMSDVGSHLMPSTLPPILSRALSSRSPLVTIIFTANPALERICDNVPEYASLPSPLSDT